MPYRITEDCTGCGQCVQWCPTRAIMGRRRVSYRIEADHCVDCGACGRICTFAAVIRPDGKIAQRVRRSQWERPTWTLEACTQCNRCIPACPVECVQIAGYDDQEGAIMTGYPYLSRPRLCIGCGFCSEACLEGVIQMRALEVENHPPVGNYSNLTS